jgi:phosphoserine phosphatase RsbU/P
MVLTSIGRRGALAVAGVLIALTTLYVAAWIYYSGGDRPASARLGISYDFSQADGALRVTAVEPGTPAEAAGLRIGDEIVAINGRPLVNERPIHDEILHARPGTVVRLSVRRADGGTSGIDATLIEPRPAERTFHVRFVTQAVTQGALRLYPLGFFIVLVVLLLQRPQDRNAWLVALLFAGFIAAAPLDPDLVHERGIRAFGLAYKTFFFTLAPALFLYLFAVFPVRSPIDRRWPWLKRPFLAVGAALAAALAVQVVSSDSWDPIQGALRDLTLTGLLVQLYSAAGMLLGAVSLIGTYRASHDPETRRRINVIVWGTAISLTPFLALQIAAGARPVGEVFTGGWFWLYAPAVLALFVLPISFAYAVVKYRVIEIPLLLKRSARYLLVQRGFVVLVALSGLVATVALVRLFPPLAPDRPDLAVPAGLVAGVGFGLTLAWAGVRVRRRVSPWIDRKFFRSAYDARRILEDLAAHAAEATSRESLAAEIEQCVREALHPERLLVYFADAGGRLTALGGEPPPALAILSDVEAWLPPFENRDEPLVIEAREDEPHPVPPLAPLAPECLAPITGRGGALVGLLVLGRRRSDEPYSAEDRRLLHAVSVQAGMALDNFALAERMAVRLESERRAERELTIAQEVQGRLLPQAPPPRATLDLRGVCIQARAVGGDYYDFLDLDDGRLAIILADISGKGISAALLMANLQAHLRAQCLATGDDVARLLTTIDRFMFEATAAYHYATLFFGRYDEPTRTLVYANCGHNPPLLIRAGGEIEWLAPTAPAVGLFPTWTCATGDVRLAPGDTLIVYSDGVTEAMADDEEMFGDERLLEIALGLRAAPVDEVVATIVREVERFSGSVQEDDLTLVVARAR